MALLDYTDLQTAKNIDLTSNGQAVADNIANGILTWSASFCNRTGDTWAYGDYSDYFDGAQFVYYLANTPIDLTQPLQLSSYNISTLQYDLYTGTQEVKDDGEFRVIPYVQYPFGINSTYPFSFRSTKIDYTGGYQTLPADLKQALVELLVQRFDAVQEGGKQLTRVIAGRYTEEYTPADALPENIMMVLKRYQNVVIR